MGLDDSYLFWTEYGAFVHSDPLGAPAITRILRWIDNCDDKHAKCLDKYAPVMPTRVLDVGNSKASGTIHLLETKGKTGDYIALSHCWGKPGPFLTTRDTLEDMKAGFQLEQAPATFRDAITITRKLGIRYLWIDSLCIIQGDAEDWEIEASRMADVYRNAYLTIAASNASSDDEGFLKPRRAACSSLKVFSPLGRSAQVYLTHENTDSGEWIYNSDAFRGPLTTRGWTLQEAYLSKRKLKFLEHEILWDCQECKREEHKSSDIGNLYASNDESVEVLLPLRREDFLPVYRGWYTMVEEYSTRHLSFHADRLPALSGLASLTAMPWDGIYLAGIWWEDAVYGICWRRKNPSLIKSDCYISPSWSWASVIGPVTFPGQSGSNSDLLPLSLVSFKEHYMGHGGLDKFGRVDSGWIRIEGPLTPFSLMTASDDKHIRDMKWFIVSGIPGSKADATVLFDFEIEEAENLRLLFLLRNRWDSDALSHRDEETLFGIVVKSEKNLSQDLGENIPSDVSNDQIYKRVGFFLIENARYVKDLNLEQRVTDIVLI
ncbi:heterokaryon incompatibility protein-domain-containing protein [Xylogone sp. PMI_703]|nr:heterokaryon incompatibility protein-domain-containing protein [Xylogone sp. PMI_703]